MFKTEAHLHTSEGSGCGKLTAKEMVIAYHGAGYKTLFITDHFIKKIFESWELNSWDEKIERFMLGYRNAKAVGDALGMNILLGAELTFECCRKNHYLLYGFDIDFLKSYPELYNMSIEEFSKIAKERGYLFVNAHPYRDDTLTCTPELVDAFEVYNPNPRHDNHEDMALATAKAHSLHLTCGSDAHRYEDIARASVLSESEIKCSQDYISLVLNDRIVIGRLADDISSQ